MCKLAKLLDLSELKTRVVGVWGLISRGSKSLFCWSQSHAVNFIGGVRLLICLVKAQIIDIDEVTGAFCCWVAVKLIDDNVSVGVEVLVLFESACIFLIVNV